MEEKIYLPDRYSHLELSTEWELVLRKCKYTNENLNIIGPSGVGKTQLLKILCETDNFLKGNKVVLSPTGIASFNASNEGIKGTTIHHFFNFAPLTIYPTTKININPHIYELINNIDNLIIDEIGFTNCSLFDYMIETLLYYRSKQYKNIPRIILFGDVLQLPPVVNMKDTAISKYFNDLYNGNIFYFNSFSFRDIGFVTIHLNKIYRQLDTSFQNILNRIRQGSQTNEDLNIINSRNIDEGKFFDENNGYYTYLTTKNEIVNELNQCALQTLNTEIRRYKAITTGKFDIKSKAFLSELLELKKGIKVVCTRNSTTGFYQNGTLGEVEELYYDSVKIKSKNGKIITVQRETWEDYDYHYDSSTKTVSVNISGTFNNIALRLAEAITIHKSQGQTIDAGYIDFDKWTPEAIVYVALSRIKTLEGIGLRHKIKHNDIKVNKEALDFLTNFS